MGNLTFEFLVLFVIYIFSLKPKTFKMERLTGNEFVFNGDVTLYKNVQQLIAAYNSPDGAIYLQECLPPSEYGK